ncbi:MAG: 2Fe-2S iron-sulfur cluster-binding protein [Chryseosolibacter sp.]
MARIMIENLFKRTIMASDHSKSLLKHFQDNQIDWMHACGAKGRCTTCKVVILDGLENFESLTKAEEKYLHLGALKAGERLACQAKIRGDVRLLVPKENQLPHMIYSDEV